MLVETGFAGVSSVLAAVGKKARESATAAATGALTGATKNLGKALSAKPVKPSTSPVLPWLLGAAAAIGLVLFLRRR